MEFQPARYRTRCSRCGIRCVSERNSRFTAPNSGLTLWNTTGYHDWENSCASWTDCF